MKRTEWKLEDQIKTKNDLIHYMDAVLGEYKSSFLPQNNDDPAQSKNKFFK